MVRHVALVPAAGSGARFGAQVPKQYLDLAGKPMIYHTLVALCRCAMIDEVWVVLSPDDAWWRTFDWTALGGKLRVVFTGGASRAETVANGLVAMEATVGMDDWILVHDAARPCLSRTMIESLCNELDGDPVGGLLAVPVADTLKRADSAQRVEATENRDGLWQAQTPQMFRYNVLRRVLSGNLSVTDEAGAIEAAGLRPRLVRSDATNFKVTYPADLRLAALILKTNQNGAGE